MKYAIKLNPKNLDMHLEIEKDIQRIKSGLFNFVIKINRGVIVDYVLYENYTFDTELTFTLID